MWGVIEKNRGFVPDFDRLHGVQRLILRIIISNRLIYIAVPPFFLNGRDADNREK